MTRTSKRRLALAIVLLALGLCGLLVAVSMRAEDAPEPAAAFDPPAPGIDPVATAAVAPPIAAEEPARETILSVAPPRETLVDAAELARAIWIEGRVVMPENTPPDEHLVVVARGHKFANKALHRASVGADGRFRVAFAEGTGQGSIDLEARYLYLVKPCSLRPRRADAQELVLEPALGGCLRGRCVPGAALAARAEAYAKIDVSAGGVREVAGERRFVSRRAQIEGALDFEFGGLPPGMSLSVRARPRGAAEVVLATPALKPGEVRSVVLELVPGVKVRGRVQDESGAGIAGAAFGVFPIGVRSAIQPSGIDWIRSGADGAFELPPLPAGSWSLEAQLAGYVAPKLELRDLEDGEVREGIVLVLARGSAIAGRVTWPDGAPAAAADIRWIELGPGARREIDGTSRIASSADGSFVISGLVPERSYRITARARRDAGAATKSKHGPELPRPATSEHELGSADVSEARSDDESGGAKSESAGERERGEHDSISMHDETGTQSIHPRGRDGVDWEASADAAAGTLDIVLVLQGGASLAGRVLDDTGQPLARFEVIALPANRLDPWDERKGRVQRTFEGAREGAFVLDGLREGDWDVRARASGHAESLAKRVHVPLAGAAFEVRLMRAAKISGRVVGPTGEPVSSARCEVASARPVTGPTISRPPNGATSDREGRFEIAGIEPGPQILIASLAGFADSEPSIVDCAAGGAHEGIVLALRRGGTLTGEVLDDAGAPAAACRLFVYWNEGRRALPQLVTDGKGQFEIDALAPGRYSIRVTEEQGRKVPISGEASAKIVEGESVHVVLGGSEPVAVRVHGVVRCAGRPVAGVAVRAMQAGRIPPAITSDRAGRYRLELPRAGVATIWLDEDGSSNGMTVTIPEGVQEYELDLELPGGSIHGRVVRADGKPAAMVHVRLETDRTSAERSAAFSSGWQQSAEDGGFAFEHVCAGTYRLQAGTVGVRWTADDFGTAIREGIRVEEGARLEIELRMSRGCTLQGTVLDDEGRAAAGACVFGRDEQGTAFSSSPLATTDAAGRFRVDQLPEGRAVFFARTGSSASVESSPVTMRAGEPGEIELRLLPGTRLFVEVEEAGGKKVGAQLRVFDPSGRESGGFWVPSLTEEQWIAGQFAGTFPPGVYRVVATNHSGASAEKQAVLHGEPRVGVTLRY